MSDGPKWPLIPIAGGRPDASPTLPAPCPSPPAPAQRDEAGDLPRSTADDTIAALIRAAQQAQARAQVEAGDRERVQWLLGETRVLRQSRILTVGLWGLLGFGTARVVIAYLSPPPPWRWPSDRIDALDGLGDPHLLPQPHPRRQGGRR